MIRTPSRLSAADLSPGATAWIGALILTMPVRQMSLAQFGAAQVRLGDLVLSLALGVWFVSMSVNKGPSWRRFPLDWAVLTFVAVYALSLVWSDQSEHGWVRVFKLLRNLALYAMVVAYLQRDFANGYRRIAMFLIAAGLMQSGAFLYSIAQNGGLQGLQELANATSLLSNDERLGVVKTENGAGLFLRGAASWFGLCVFFALGAAHRMPTRRGTVYVWSSVILMGVLTILTLTRSAWIAMAVGGVAYVAGVRPRFAVRLIVLALLGWGALQALGGTAPILNIVGSRLAPDALANDPALEERALYFTMALDSFWRSPFLGGGAAGIDPGEFITVHNVYLQVLGELGLLGVVVFGSLLLRWVHDLWSCWRRSIALRDDALRRTAAAIGGGTLFFLTYFLAGHDLESSEPWMLMAAASALYGASRSALLARRPVMPPFRRLVSQAPTLRAS